MEIDSNKKTKLITKTNLEKTILLMLKKKKSFRK